MYWQQRGGQPTWNMQYAFRGHMVIVVDQPYPNLRFDYGGAAAIQAV